jgi:O-methyltransferase
MWRLTLSRSEGVRALKGVALSGGFGAWLRRTLIRRALLFHNGEKVENYNARSWYLAPFPVEKGVPYVADNLATVNTSTFRFDPLFMAAVASAESRWPAGKRAPRDVSWRLHVALFAARLGLSVASRGDCFVELGTGRGFMAAGILESLGPASLSERGISFFLMDSFSPGWQGENQKAWQSQQMPNAEGAEPWYYADGSAEVLEYFSSFPGVKVVEGLLPETLQLTGSSHIAFAHVDLNSAAAEESCLSAIRTRLKVGSVLLFDDSTNPGCEEQLQVHRGFASSLGTYLLELPTGQSIMVCD